MYYELCVMECVKGRFVRPTFGHRHLLRLPVLAHRLLEKGGRCGLVPLGSPKEIDGVSFLVDRSVQVFPLPAHLDIQRFQ